MTTRPKQAIQLMEKSCIYCEHPFTPKRSSSEVCGSKVCQEKHKKEHGKKGYIKRKAQGYYNQDKPDKTKVCAWCGETYPLPYKSQRSNFCGETCRTKHNRRKGKLRRDQYKRERKKAKEGIPQPPKPEDMTKGKNADWWFQCAVFAKFFEHERGRSYPIPDRYIEALRQAKDK